ncbi:MAG: ABC transporter permease [Myxococcales bacterium]|nr:ABC transporter permease [Myxococcales bacterium]
MKTLTTLRFIKALLTMNFRASLASPGVFWLQVAFMALNNLLFCVTWWILFERFEHIRGWTLADLLTLFGVGASGFGLSVVVAGGVRDLGQVISDGELDSLLTQPKSPLLQAVAARSLASGWGDVSSGLLLLGMAGQLQPLKLPILALGLTISFTVFTATGIVLQSGAFWFGRIQSLARNIWELTITFSLYPPGLFGGALKLMLFTLIPAGFITYLPVQLLRDFNLPDAALALGGALGYSALAGFVFARGLRHYESGNRVVVRI